MNNKTLPSLIFFGTPQFASYCLEYLIDSGFPISAVVTVPDRKAGRGKKLKASEVKLVALAKGLRVLQPENLKAPDFISDLEALQADTFVVVAFRMLPRMVWELPKLGTLNLHASLLPNYRGAAPINWVLINGEKQTGVTTFLINENIDTGAILMSKSLTIDPTDDIGTLHDKLLHLGAPLLKETLKGIQEGSIEPQRQVLTGNEQTAPKLTNENTQINWSYTLEGVCNQIRGLSPHPGAWTIIQNNGIELRVKIFKATPILKKHNHPPKRIVIEEKKLLVSTLEGYLNCIEIQLPNKKRMPAEALLNGFVFDVEATVLG
ncbi:MAG: methionyl-tRNA formyltransferase [Flavobacteriaceae bacterium]